MKKLLLLFIIGITIISCSKDEELELGVFTGEVTNNDLIGAWNVIDYYTNNGKINTRINGANVIADFTTQAKNFNSKITFSQNPKIVSSTGSFTNTTNLRYLTFSQSEETTQNLNLAGVWVLNNNIITITSAGISKFYTIVDFTGSTLQLKYKISENIEVVSGVSGDANATFYMSLQK